MTEIERDTPRYLLGFLIAAIFATEGAITGGLSLSGLTNGVVSGFLNSTLLSLVLFPLLYFGVFKEIRQKTNSLAAMGKELRAANARLEDGVRERTQELEDSKTQLESALADIGRKQKRLVAVRNFHRLLHSANDEREAYSICGLELPKVLPESGGAIYITKASRNVLVRVAQWPENITWDETMPPEACWALRLGQSFTSDCSGTSAACRHGHQLNTSSARQICIPLVARGESLGLLSVEVLQKMSEIEIQEYEEFVSHVASGLALAMANVQLREALKVQAYHDQLTGLFNRNFLLEALQLEFHKSDRNGKPLSIVMLDIDHFKRFNDVFGHNAGDVILAEFGRTLANTFRLGDLACRFGGEEFVVLLPDATCESAQRRVNEFLAHLRKLTVRYSGQELGPITASAGVATYRVHGNDLEGLLKAADTALYASKKAGRDRASVASVAEDCLSVIQLSPDS